MSQRDKKNERRRTSDGAKLHDGSPGNRPREDGRGRVSLRTGLGHFRRQGRVVDFRVIDERPSTKCHILPSLAQGENDSLVKSSRFDADANDFVRVGSYGQSIDDERDRRGHRSSRLDESG